MAKMQVVERGPTQTKASSRDPQDCTGSRLQSLMDQRDQHETGRQPTGPFTLQLGRSRWENYFVFSHSFCPESCAIYFDPTVVFYALFSLKGNQNEVGPKGGQKESHYISLHPTALSNESAPKVMNPHQRGHPYSTNLPTNLRVDLIRVPVNSAGINPRGEAGQRHRRLPLPGAAAGHLRRGEASDVRHRD